MAVLLRCPVRRGDERRPESGDRSGRFQEAFLYDRLNVHRIHLPPLRERGEDVRVLVDHFVARFGREAGVERCGDGAWALLSAYDYPGNVRQLEHIIQRAVAIAQGPELRPEPLARGGCRTAGAGGP